MRFDPIEVKDKEGRAIIIRSAELSDAEELITFLKKTAEETPFLIREPDEINLTLESEEAFLKNRINAPGELLLIAETEGKHIGNCSVSGMGGFCRYSHRCSIAIALYRKYANAGIGTLLMDTALLAAKRMGYEQAELEVVSSNKNAIALYQKLGFQKYGTFPNNMRYSDGVYEDADWMMKKL